VAAVKATEGRLYGVPSDLTGLPAYDVEPVPLPPQRGAEPLAVTRPRPQRGSLPPRVRR
jgi:hypothetical protein